MTQPPAPPEAPPGINTGYSPLPAPGTLEANAQPRARRQGGKGGCGWLLAGSLGCLALIVALVVAVAAGAGATLNSIVSGITASLGLAGNPPQMTRQYDIPSVEPFTLLSDLTTVRYNYAIQVNSQTDMPPLLQALYGNSQVLIAVGSVEAGVSLGGLTPEALSYDEATRTLTIRVPAPRITACYLNDQQTYVAERSSGLFAADSPALDTASRRYALAQFLRLAQESSILEDARLQTAEILTRFAQALQNDPTLNIVVEVGSADASAPLPETCQ
jgi:hypothetical protein